MMHLDTNWSKVLVSSVRIYTLSAGFYFIQILNIFKGKAGVISKHETSMHKFD